MKKEDILKFRQSTRNNIFDIIKTDARATVSNPIVVIVLIAIIILPSLYGLINIYACWDPYENTGHVQFAIANDDMGAQYNNVSVHAGNDLVKMLKNNTDFDWVFVTSDELREGVYNGTYYAGIVVPANFSECIVSITTKDPHSATLEYRVNEKSNPVAAKLTDAAAKQVYNNINAEIVTFINLAAYNKLGELQDGLASGASQLAAGGGLLSAGAGQVGAGAGQLASGANQLSDGANQLSDGANQLADGAGQVADGTHQASTTVNQVTGDISQVTSYVKNHTSSQFIHEGMDYIDEQTSNVSGKVNQLDDGAHQVADGAVSLSDGANQLGDGVNQLSQGSLSLAAGAQLLANSAASALFAASSSLSGAAGGLGDVTGLNESQIGDYFFAPVKLDRHEEFPSSNYGSQVAPFYLVLCMWVGALITCVMLKTGTSVNTRFRPHEMYLGKLALFLGLAVLQTTVTLIGCFILGIDIDNPLLFIFSCYVVAAVFMTLMYSLISLFGDVGKGIAIVLLVFQISGTGGIYPVEIMNEIFGVLYPYLPMTYGINMVREAQLGLIWANYIPAFLVLLGLGIAVFVISFILKRSFDKRTKYFEEKLDESNLFK
ncbi:YhgE/Pip domain-containing protein [uncultured Methanobrevibacter sp.]|uniref:YhgE/Pip domain-containing protein n=1 Tax=uncultured Methanobrevibacter sp. TaxID=253161 RepID=UPI0025D3B21F|nr:YhgE/Pip domain-containing protein [uncultured Methanobrevibacter sp.]